MNEDHSLGIHYIIRTVLLLGFSVFIIYLAKNDSLQYYIAPRMIGYIKLSAIGLYVVACFQGYAAFKMFTGKRIACDCDHQPSRSVIRNMLVYGLFALPLLLGFLLPNTIMDSALAAKKGINLSMSTSSMNSLSSAKSSAPAPATEPNSSPTDQPEQTDEAKPGNSATLATEQLKQMFKTDDEYFGEFGELGIKLYQLDKIVAKPEIFMEIFTSIDMFLDHFVGKEIEVSGFVYREDDLHDSQFIVARFAMQCCSADALPYGVLTEYPRAVNYEDNTWIRVTGRIEKTTYNENEIIKLKATRIEKIEPPLVPYVYPNFDFLKTEL